MDCPNRLSSAATGSRAEWVFGLTVLSHPCRKQLLVFVSTKAFVLWYKSLMMHIKVKCTEIEEKKKKTPKAAVIASER